MARIFKKTKKRVFFNYKLSCGHWLETFFDAKQGENIKCPMCTFLKTKPKV